MYCNEEKTKKIVHIAIYNIVPNKQKLHVIYQKQGYIKTRATISQPLSVNAINVTTHNQWCKVKNFWHK